VDESLLVELDVVLPPLTCALCCATMLPAWAVAFAISNATTAHPRRSKRRGDVQR
jgi:hypothetical protein